jgi:hypothetical protein
MMPSRASSPMKRQGHRHRMSNDASSSFLDSRVVSDGDGFGFLRGKHTAV